MENKFVKNSEYFTVVLNPLYGYWFIWDRTKHPRKYDKEILVNNETSREIYMILRK